MGRLLSLRFYNYIKFLIRLLNAKFQNRFILSGSTGSYNETYWVPINFATTDNPDFEDTTATLWLTSSSLNYNASLSNSSWIVINKQQTGMYIKTV